VAACYRKARNQRRDHAHRLSRQLVKDYDVTAHERLAISSMMRRPPSRPDGKGGFEQNGLTAKVGLNRSIQDAGWVSCCASSPTKRKRLGGR
jgi:putative transposase